MKLVSILLIALFFPLSAATQNPTPGQQQAGTVTVNVDRHLVAFTVSDNKGKFITTLKKDDFKIFEDDKLQTVTDFSSETNLPLVISLIVDSSGSIRDKLRFEQEAAIEFFHTALKRGKDRADVIDFDTKADLQQAFTDDPDKLTNAVHKILPGGGTAMFDAVYLAITHPDYGLAKQDGRRLIILISDGDDNASRTSLQEMLEAAQKYDVAIYPISTNKTADFSRADQQRGDKTLKQLAADTGGTAYFPQKLTDLTSSFQQITQELRSQYTILYSPTNKVADGTFRRIKIAVADKRYKARTPVGYYAQRASLR
jgi:VWFA-related protein